MGYSLQSIPKIDHDFQRAALTLFREASAANNNYLSFLFYWQVLESRNTDGVSYVNNVYRKKRNEVHLQDHWIASLAVGGQSLGAYLQNDWRHAISHIRRSPGKKVLQLNSITEQSKLAISTEIVKAFAVHYIKHAIELNESLYLVRKSTNSFPIFVSRRDMQRCGWRLAYSLPRPKLHLKRAVQEIS